MKRLKITGHRPIGNTQMRNLLLPVACYFLLILSSSCNGKKKEDHSKHTENVSLQYTCPMHPEIVKNKPGICPICGMDLTKKETGVSKSENTTLELLLQPANEFVVSKIPVITIQRKEEEMEIEALGNIAYDTRQAGSISSRVSGRIEKLYVRYRYQEVSRGRHILDLYSPELMTAQQNLLFLIKNDPANTAFIHAAKEKLLLLGISNRQLQQIIQSGKPLLTIAVYSNYNGHIHEAINSSNMNNGNGTMSDISFITEELALKEGMYLQKGQSIFVVYDPDKAWAIINIYAEHQGLVKTGNTVSIIPETAPEKKITGTINFIEPFYRKESKTLTARVYFNNSTLKIPIGSRVRATIFGNNKDAYWLPKESVVSIGLDKIVFQKINGGFKAHKITTGLIYNNYIQILSGITETDSVAMNAQYLMDSESFIIVKK